MATKSNQINQRGNLVTAARVLKLMQEDERGEQGNEPSGN